MSVDKLFICVSLFEYMHVMNSQLYKSSTNIFTWVNGWIGEEIKALIFFAGNDVNKDLTYCLVLKLKYSVL